MNQKSNQRYWFRPLRFWKVFAFYYPSSREGVGLTAFLVFLLATLFYFTNIESHSVSDTLMHFAPWLIVGMLLFDLFCFRFGEYPAWWHERKRKHPFSHSKRVH